MASFDTEKLNFWLFDWDQFPPGRQSLPHPQCCICWREWGLQPTKQKHQHHRDQYHGPSERFPKCPQSSTRGTGCLRSLQTPDITPIIPTQQSVNWGKHAALERHSRKQHGISSDGSYATQDGRREQSRALTGEEKAWTKNLINCIRTGQVYSQSKAGAGALAGKLGLVCPLGGLLAFSA